MKWDQNRVFGLNSFLHISLNYDGFMLQSVAMNKASGGDGLSYFKSWKMMLWKCSTQYASKFGKLSSGHRTGKCVFIPIPKKDSAKECSNYCTIALISHASRVMFKILQARIHQYMNSELLINTALKRWCCESAALNMQAHMENSAVSTELENVFSFQSQRKAMPKKAQTTAQLHSSHMLVK